MVLSKDRGVSDHPARFNSPGSMNKWPRPGARPGWFQRKSTWQSRLAKPKRYEQWFSLFRDIWPLKMSHFVLPDIRRDCNDSIILKHILEREVEGRIAKPENRLLIILMSKNATRLIYSAMAERHGIPNKAKTQKKKWYKKNTAEISKTPRKQAKHVHRS